MYEFQHESLHESEVEVKEAHDKEGFEDLLKKAANHEKESVTNRKERDECKK